MTAQCATLQIAADGVGHGAEARHQLMQDIGSERLLAIAFRHIGRIMHLHHDGVSAGGDGGERHLRNKRAQSDAVSRIDHHWQCVFAFKIGTAFKSSV